jgi:sec-independent protein translocase protein TatA
MSLSPAIAFLNLSGPELILIMFFCLLMFGSKKLPELAKAMGQSMKEFKKAASEVEDNFHNAVQEEERKKAAPPPPPAAPAQASQSQPAQKL